MFTVIAVAGLLLLLALAGADLMVSDMSSDEQARMGIKH
jgi:hypothetical protein